MGSLYLCAFICRGIDTNMPEGVSSVSERIQCIQEVIVFMSVFTDPSVASTISLMSVDVHHHSVLNFGLTLRGYKAQYYYRYLTVSEAQILLD